MKKRPIIFVAVTTAAVAVALLFILETQHVLDNEPLHATLEAVEGLSVLLMSLFLLHRKEETLLALPAVGFLGMGILGLAHAASWPGQQFVILKALSNLLGGAGFALVLLPESRQAAVQRMRPHLSILAVSLALCVLAFLLPGVIPVMVHEGEFGNVPLAINFLAGLLFLAGTSRFILYMHRTGSTEHLLFSIIGVFFGLSGLTFQYSRLWSESWWYWHVLRLIAALLVLGLLVLRHLQTITRLEISLSERKAAENSLRRSYTLTKTIIDSMNDAVSLIDVQNFKIIGVNRVFLKEYGFSDESEVVGKHCYEITHRRKDVCTAPDDVCPLAEAVRSGEHFSADHVHYGRNGEKLYVEVSTSPITDESGKVIQVVHVSRDITSRKQAEQEREHLLADVERSNRELEQFAYVASHDLQEPLRMVASYTGLLEKRYKGQLDEKADKYIFFAVDGARRMQNLIEGLLAYSRVSTQGRPFGPVDLNAVFQDAVANLSSAAGAAHASITKEELPVVTGDETQMLQLFQNLLGNAIKFRKLDLAPQVHVSAVQKGKVWQFRVSDNGIGIAPAYFERVFQVFQRLHSQQEYAGTGIGLAVCKKIVERHGGRIWLESMPGQGTSFLFTIPAG